jgi:hypothetical protein
VRYGKSPFKFPRLSHQDNPTVIEPKPHKNLNRRTKMGDGADDARRTEELWEDLQMRHHAKVCDPDDCPYCDPDFKPFFTHQVLREKPK